MSRPAMSSTRMGGRGALDYRIKPLAPVTSVMVGVAITCHCGPADNLALFAALAMAQGGRHPGGRHRRLHRDRGDRRSADGHGAQSRPARPGDRRPRARLCRASPASGCRSIARASRPIRRPATGRGRSACRWWSAAWRSNSGDIVIGDNDGIVVVRPAARQAAVLETLPDIRAAEAALEAKVKAGLEVPDFIQAILASDRVVEI